MMTNHFVRYVIVSSLCGGAVGLGHAYPTKKVETAFYYGISGLVLGPWAPIVIPATMFASNTRCSLLRTRPTEE